MATTNAIPERVIPCLDVRDGRVVKGVNFVDIRDAGDPVECAMRYEAEGADELVILDISATDANRTTALETVRRVSESLFIPLTVGGGVRTIEDFRALLRAGADRVAINTAALRNPQLIADCAREFGVQAVVLSCDAKRTGDHFEAMVRSGKESSGVDAVAWCRRAEELGDGRNPAHVGRPRRHQQRLRHRAAARRHQRRQNRRHRLAAAPAASNISATPSKPAARARSSPHRSFTIASLSIGDVKQFLASEGIPVR